MKHLLQRLYLQIGNLSFENRIWIFLTANLKHGGILVSSDIAEPPWTIPANERQRRGKKKKKCRAWRDIAVDWFYRRLSGLLMLPRRVHQTKRSSIRQRTWANRRDTITNTPNIGSPTIRIIQFCSAQPLNSNYTEYLSTQIIQSIHLLKPSPKPLRRVIRSRSSEIIFRPGAEFAAVETP